MPSIRLGCRLPNMGIPPRNPGIAEMAHVAEESGADALHLSDHIVIPEQNASRYPFTADGRFPFPPDSDWYDVFVSCAWAAASTTTIEVGPSVLVLPQRNALEVAKTTSTLSQLSDGRLFLGIGAGWLREEFTALGKDFGNRTSAMTEAIQVLRIAWSGKTEEDYAGESLSVPSGIHCRPLPDSRGVPLLLGGMSAAALRRAARYGDGWLALASDADHVETIAAKLRILRGLRREYGMTGPFRDVIRLLTFKGAASGTAARIREYADLGFDEIVIDPGWADLSAAAKLIERCGEVLRS